MSGTIKAGVLQHPDSATGNVTLNDDGSVETGALTAPVVVAGNTPGHNLLHNGAMQVAQRGTPSTATGTSAPTTADRWAIYGDVASATASLSVESDAPTGSGFRKSLKWLVTNAGTVGTSGQQVVAQRIEGQNLQSVKKGTTAAEQLTLSFWTKSNKTGTYVVELQDVDNTRHVAATYTVVASATWEQQSITFPADLTGAFDNDTALSLSVNFYLAAGTNFTSGTLATTWATNTAANRAVGQTNLAANTNNYWMVTGCQLEVGSASTGFEHKDYGTELAECQRYYWQTGQGYQCMGQAYTTTNVVGFFNYPVQMRTPPSALAKVGAATDYCVYKADANPATCSAVPTFLTSTVNVMGVTFSVASGLVAGNATICGSLTSAGVFGFSADL